MPASNVEVAIYIIVNEIIIIKIAANYITGFGLKIVSDNRVAKFFIF